jgi:hypothetical protein
VNARKYSKEHRDRLASMADDELLAYERERPGNPYTSLRQAKELQKIALKFWHLRRTPAATFGRSCGRMDRDFVLG